MCFRDSEWSECSSNAAAVFVEVVTLLLSEDLGANWDSATDDERYALTDCLADSLAPCRE